VESIGLGFKSFDVHELACHFVARHTGLYARHGLDVALADTTFGATDRPPLFSAACGAALCEWLGGADNEVVFVAAERPMFWLYARSDARGLDDLAGKAIAGYPDAAPPAALSQVFLQGRGVGPDTVTLLPARDDAARIGLLGDNAVDAAVVSSAVAPRILEQRGFRELAWFGEDLRVPTTGLAIPAGARPSHGDVIDAMRACYHEALALIHDEIGVLEAALAEIVTANDADQAAMASRVRRAYTRDGRCSRATLETGVESLATALRCRDVRAIDSLYASVMSAD
jgi:hypothetical protein